MILKSWIKEGYEYVDNIQRVHIESTYSNSGDKQTLKIAYWKNLEDIATMMIISRDKQDIPNNPVYLLNDEGKTIERIN